MDSEESQFLRDVRALLLRTQTNEITLAEFEPRFLQLHAEMPLSTPESNAQAIEDLFWTVEAFVGEPELRTDSDPDERALLEAISTCLSRLGS